MDDEIKKLADDITAYWKTAFQPYLDAGGRDALSKRPVAKIVQSLLDLKSYHSDEARQLVASQVAEFTGVAISEFGKKSILIAASENGVWASELTIVASMLLAAGYQVVVATETGKSPHLLSVSCDASTVDGSLGVSVVSKAEETLAKRFLDPGTSEGKLILSENVVSLSDLIRPPIVGDYFENQDATMAELHSGILAMGEWLSKYDGVVVAGGSGAVAGFSMGGGISLLLTAFQRVNKPIVAQCNGVFALVHAIDPASGQSLLNGRLATTHSMSHEYRRGGWGWANVDEESNEVWTLPGADGNPIIDSEPLVKNAVGVNGRFYSPPASPYAVAVDGKIITARTTPDGAPATMALLAILDGDTPFDGRYFIEDERGFRPFD